MAHSNSVNQLAGNEHTINNQGVETPTSTSAPSRSELIDNLNKQSEQLLKDLFDSLFEQNKTHKEMNEIQSKKIEFLEEMIEVNKMTERRNNQLIEKQQETIKHLEENTER